MDSFPRWMFNCVVRDLEEYGEDASYIPKLVRRHNIFEESTFTGPTEARLCEFDHISPCHENLLRIGISSYVDLIFLENTAQS